MRRTALLLVVLVAWLAGCKTAPVTTFEHGPIRLEVSGRLLRGGQALAPGPGPAIARGSPVTALYRGGTQALQVQIDVKFITLDPNASLRDLAIWPGSEELIRAASVKDTTPQPPRITVGSGFAFGGGGHGGHGDSAEWSDRGHEARGGPTFGLGMGVPVELGGGKRTTSVRVTFEHPTLHVVLDQSYLVATFWLGRTIDDKVRIQQWLMPIELTDKPKPKPTPPPRTITTSVRVPDGQTVILWGLIESKDKPHKKVPILSRIPTLNRLFTTDRSRAKKENLLIFVTPHIIMDEQ